MKPFLILIAAMLLCVTVSAAAMGDEEHYVVVVVVWSNVTGAPESDVAVTFDGTHTLYTADDGSVVFDTANLDVQDGSDITVSCKYGVKTFPIIYSSASTRNYGMAVTFNEPDEATATALLAAMGFAAVAIGGGRYLLRRKKSRGSNMTEETTDKTGSKLLRDFGVRALFGTIALLGYIGITSVAIVTDRTDMVSIITNWYMPLIMAIVGFYFGGSTAAHTVK